MVALTWLLEAEMFPESHERMREAVSSAGFAVATWKDEWWINGRWPRLERIVFHGSLGNAARIRAELPWRPGAFCATEEFHCSAWYPRATEWLLHRRWVSTTVAALVADAPGVLKEIGSPEMVFVRPDSPLKPFSGRVLRSSRGDDPSGEPWSLASHIGASLAPPEATYVMDICESDAGLRLLELNPFSGADLYACDLDAVVAAVSKCALRP